jgi:hypothetical protein
MHEEKINKIQLFVAKYMRGKYLKRPRSERDYNIKRIFNTAEDRGWHSSGLGCLLLGGSVKGMVLYCLSSTEQGKVLDLPRTYVLRKDSVTWS